MGYTTDADYLIQAGQDIAELRHDADTASNGFNHESPIPWDAWGRYAEDMRDPYDYVRAAMHAAMQGVGNLLDAYGQALQKAGQHYKEIERANVGQFGGIR
jgi:uncharacterized protein YukE